MKRSGGRWLPFVVCLFNAGSGWAGDWPQWRYDASRSAASHEALPENLKHAWTRQLPQPRPAWPASQTKLQFDAGYEPIVVGTRLIVGSNVDDSLAAYDTRSGEELWRFFAEGPIRFAPAGHNGYVYAVSDDGYLYCLDAADGKLLWKFRGGPAQRLIIGNDRLVSTWPARGGPVIADGVVYFTAGIWPSMGIFVHALDAESGRVVWTNSETGSRYIVHPHGAPSFGSVVPQGHLVVSGDALIVPGGRSTPAIFDRHTGELRYFQFDKRVGDHRVSAGGGCYFVGGGRYLLSDGSAAGSSEPAIITPEATIAWQSDAVVAHALEGKSTTRSIKDRRGRVETKTEFETRRLWSLKPPRGSVEEIHMAAGRQLYASADDKVSRFDMPADGEATQPESPAWQVRVDGRVRTMLAGDEKLFVVTEGGQLMAFSADATSPRVHRLEPQSLPRRQDRWTEVVASFRTRPQICEGYAVVLGVGSGRLTEELLRQTSLVIVVVDADADRVEEFRRRMQRAGVYGDRVAAVTGRVASAGLPPYLANLIVSERPLEAESDADSLAILFESLRPYGGEMRLPLSDEQHELFARSVQAAALANAELSRDGAWTVLTRAGALPGAADWTHQYADAANSVVSQDDRVKAPLGVLWFGGPSHDKILPRHGHGPSPQVAGGRLFIEGPDLLRAVDVFTGRLLWEKELPGLGTYYDTTRHFAGAGEIGGNYISLPESVYVVYDRKILELDATTGETVREFPHDAEGDWGTIAVWRNFLVAASGPVAVRQDDASPASIAAALEPVRYSSASRRLVVFDRDTGRRLWSRDAVYNFRHNCIAACDGKLFCIDGMSQQKLQLLKRRGVAPEKDARLLALELATGEELWSTDEDVFGTFLNYSAEHDVLLQAGSAYRDRAKDEVDTGMVAYRGSDGSVLWKDLTLEHNGPCLLWGDRIITNGGSGFQLELLTGQRSGWTFSRMYGCNTVVGSRHLLTFRSGAAGFCDLTGDSGTGNLGGFRSSCTANLIAADGVLNAPDYTRTCSCAYQNQTSLAFVHMPEAELWAFNNSPPDDPAERIGLNLGAPGDRRDGQGTLWLDFPSVGGPSPDLGIKLQPEKPDWFRKHHSQIEGEGLKWVAASGLAGLQSLIVSLHKDAKLERNYTVRLHFCEPERIEAGDRVFDVLLQDATVLTKLDIVRDVGGPNRPLVKEFRGIALRDDLKITLRPHGGRPAVLSGVEVVAEDR